MDYDKFMSKTFPIKCKGRDFQRKEVFEEPVDVRVKVYKKPGSDIISSEVNCMYNCGGHGDKCRATDSVNPVYCPYAFDLPNALDKRF